MFIRLRPNRISKNRTFKTASCLATYFVCASAGQAVRCEACSLALYRITYSLGRCSESRVFGGWCSIEWVEAVRIIRTYPPLYVLGTFVTRLATKSITKCLAPR